MLTAEQIAAGKRTATYRSEDVHHEHDDCIRIAYEWLDAQVKTKGISRTQNPIKHFIEAWAKRYVSTSDVIVAANIHPDVRGTYPYFNISNRLVRPNQRRLDGIGEAGKHGYDRYEDVYSRDEG